MERRQAAGGVRARRTSDQDENVGIGEGFAPSSMIGGDIVEEYGGAIDAASRLSGRRLPVGAGWDVSRAGAIGRASPCVSLRDRDLADHVRVKLAVVVERPGGLEDKLLLGIRWQHDVPCAVARGGGMRDEVG